MSLFSCVGMDRVASQYQFGQAELVLQRELCVQQSQKPHYHSNPHIKQTYLT